MPVDIGEDCLVVYEGEMMDIVNPIFILRNNIVSLAYANSQATVAWYYDADNNSIESKVETRTGFAREFISKTGLLNHSGANLSVQVVTKEMVTFKAVPISGLNNLNYIEDEPTDI